MTNFCHQLKLLLWKNYLLRKRHKARVVIEFLWPLVLFLILTWVRTRGLKENRKTCHHVPKALPSVGGFEFFQNFLCTLSNGCFTEPIEDDPDVWHNAGINKFITGAVPILKQLMSNNQTQRTVNQLWQSLNTFGLLAAGIRSKSQIEGMSRIIPAKALMTEDGRKGFVDTAKMYTGLSEATLEEALEAEINFDAVNPESLRELIQDFQSGNCDAGKTYKMLNMTSESSYKEICQLGPQKAFLLLYVFSLKMDKDGLARQIQSGMTYDKVMNDTEQLKSVLGPYDQNVLDSFYQLGRMMTSNTSNVTELLNRTTPIRAQDSKMVYEFICGSPGGSSNDTLFGIQADSPTRTDSLRDNLRDVGREDENEIDPEISPACNTIFMRLESQKLTAFLWRQLKPFIRGSIFYAPENNFTREIMQRVDAKFEELKSAEDTVSSFLGVLHRTRVWIRNNSALVDALKVALSDPALVDTLLTSLQVNMTAEERAEFLKVVKFFTELDLESTLENVDLVAEVISELMGCVKYNKTRGFATENAAVDAALPMLKANTLWGVIVFDPSTNQGTIPHHLHYKIRMDSDKVDSTRSIRDRLTTKHPRRRPLFDLKYITNGFVYLQEFIERSFVEMYTGMSMEGTSLLLQQSPFPCYIFDQFVRAISRTFPLFMVLSWVYASSMIIKSIVLEKEKHLREVMKVMGLGNTVIWFGWFIDSFVVLSLSATVLSAILKWGKVIELADFSLILAFMISFTVSVICFSFLVSTFFNRANSAAAAGGIIFFIMYLPYNFFLLWEEQLTWYHMMLGCLMSNVAFGFGCNYFARLEEDGVGAQWDRIAVRTAPDDDFNLSYCMFMLWFDSALYLLLTFYIEAIRPGAAGTPKPWYFLCRRKSREDKSKFDGGSLLTDEDSLVETEPADNPCGVSVINLCKTYSNGKVALENLNINFYENQITSFLGHNGAGKTTTISILTGLFPPSRGTAFINGHNIRSEMGLIRQDLGICPQFNVLFDRLTVSDHIIFFSSLKGQHKEATREEVDKILMDLGIPHKRNEFPKNLSGGMKRKLSVAIAFVGGSKTVFLDEPTSGVDPFSRRSIWELLLKYKQGRTIILTTHFMDEADLLGDRIAIISQGRLKTCGSSLFLKNKFGEGYSLRMVRREGRGVPTPEVHRAAQDDKVNQSGRDDSTKKQNLSVNGKGVEESMAGGKSTEAILNFVKLRVPAAILVDDVGSEVTILLPYAGVHAFPGLLNDLDGELDGLGISSYGISDTTLEDVFLRITTEDLEHADSITTFGKKRRFMGYLCPCCLKAPEVNKVDYSRIKNNGVGPGHVNGAHGRHDESSPHNSTGGVSEANSGSFPRALGTGSRPESNALLDAGQQRVVVNVAGGERERPLRRKRNARLILAQVGAILMKRVRNSNRNLKAMFFEIILPALFIALTLAFTLILPTPSDEAPLRVTPFVYPSPNYIYFSESNGTLNGSDPRRSPNSDGPAVSNNNNDPVGDEYFARLIDQLTGPIGLGVECLNDSLSYGLCHPTEWSKASVDKFNDERLKFTAEDARLGNCSCATGAQVCPRNVEWKSPPKLRMPTGDFILDTSKYRLPQWLLKTYKKYDTHRYGGYQFFVKQPYPVNLTSFISLIDGLTSPSDDRLDDDVLSETLDKNGIKIWFDNKGWLSSIAYLNSLHNIILRDYVDSNNNSSGAGSGDGGGGANDVGITLMQHPLNLTESQRSKEALKVSALGVIHAICVIFALSFVPASFTVYLIEERVRGGKHLHLVSGVKPFTYWTSNFLFDMAKYLIPALLCLCLFIAFDAKAYISSVSIGAFCLLLFLYGWASIPLMYPASYVFGIPSTAFVVLACGNLFIGVITTVSTFVLEQFGDKELEEIGDILKKVFLIFPQYCLGRGLIELVRLDIMHTAQETFHVRHYQPNRFDWEYLGKMHVLLAIQGVLFFLLNLALDYKQILFVPFRRKSERLAPINNEEDEDVKAERDRVETHADENSTLFAENLTKFYRGKQFPSVNRLCFTLDKGECFGLLGVNGAGKTSTFKMLTGDVRISSGRARICGFDVDLNRDKARKHFGYCPQEDGLDPLLDGFEQLELYAKLRGLGSQETKEASLRLIETLGLTRYARRRCGTYSGGNKRKLSTAVALVGDPDIVFLDEPTSGMDPGARRQLWRVVLDLIHGGKSIVLTSHSMEECEALCTRIGIMVNGKFVCLGSTQHLKNRFGSGYMLTIRCEMGRNESFLELMEERLPFAKLEDSHFTQLKYSIPQDRARLSQIFQVMYSAKGAHLIEDYSLSQTTLDDIFVRFASQQKDELDHLMGDVK